MDDTCAYYFDLFGWLVRSFNRILCLPTPVFYLPVFGLYLSRSLSHTLFFFYGFVFPYQATTGAGFSFSAPYLYDGLVFGGDPFYVECADNLTNVDNCSAIAICAVDGTTHVAEITALAPNITVVSVTSSDNLYRQFINGCKYRKPKPKKGRENCKRRKKNLL